jgi:hypothetical protein
MNDGTKLRGGLVCAHCGLTATGADERNLPACRRHVEEAEIFRRSIS